jgi:hypothetical protein
MINSKFTHRRGFTILELMIATLISLMVMGATVQLFGVVGDKISSGRALIETNDRIRAAQNLLRLDLQGRTSSMFPWEQASAGNGYFEILKGGYRDQYPNPDTLTGYTRDALMLTTHTTNRPFVGRFNGTTAESNVAEVAWFLQPMMNAQGSLVTIPNPNNPNGNALQLYSLYRKVFIVLPGVTMPANATVASWQTYFDSYDVSAHLDTSTNTYKPIPNSLQDLTYRENRFAHNYNDWQHAFPVVFPDQTQSNWANQVPQAVSSLTPFPLGDPRYGEDVVLTNVLSFDIKVWDPQAIVRSDGANPGPAHALVPSDQGYLNGSGALAAGAYVDLYYNLNPQTRLSSNAGNSYFSGPAYGSGLGGQLDATNNNYFSTYDNWCSGYEYFYNSNAPIGQSVNGFDDNQQTNSAVDDPSERISSPPYPVPLRGVQINLRVYEPSSRAVREATIDESFVPD